MAYEGRLSVLSASYDPQSSPDAKPPASSTPPAPKGTNGGSGSHLPSPSAAAATAATMFPFGMHQTTAAAAPGLPDSNKAGFESSLKSALEQPRPTSRLDELFQSKSSQVGLSLSVPPPQRRLVNVDITYSDNCQLTFHEDFCSSAYSVAHQNFTMKILLPFFTQD